MLSSTKHFKYLFEQPILWQGEDGTAWLILPLTMTPTLRQWEDRTANCWHITMPPTIRQGEDRTANCWRITMPPTLRQGENRTANCWHITMPLTLRQGEDRTANCWRITMPPTVRQWEDRTDKLFNIAIEYNNDTVLYYSLSTMWRLTSCCFAKSPILTFSHLSIFSEFIFLLALILLKLIL